MALDELIKKLREARPARWENMPDIPLYMDQVLSYMTRQLIDVGDGEKLTAAMVNNYIKAGLLPRAEEKRYGREHIALLTSICVFKNIMKGKEMKPLLDQCVKQSDVVSFYSGLSESLDREMSEAAGALCSEMTRAELSAAAVELAVAAYCRQLVCAKIIDILDSADTRGNV